jgi:hypothetical protein
MAATPTNAKKICIKAKCESTKLLHQTIFLNTYNKLCFETAYLGKTKNLLKQKGSPTCHNFCGLLHLYKN